MNEVNGAVVHIRFEGRSVDIPVADLDFGSAAGDVEVKRAVAGYLDGPRRNSSIMLSTGTRRAI